VLHRELLAAVRPFNKRAAIGCIFEASKNIEKHSCHGDLEIPLMEREN
jgi:hypothetical protein